MFALELNRQAMLAEVHAAVVDAAVDLRGPSDRRFVTAAHAHLVVRGHTPDDLLPVLTVALSQRFWDVPARHLVSELLHPLKKGVGNAFKWGNGKDESKRVTVDVVATRAGAVVAITDEGAGFDVRQRLRTYREGRRYFSHSGSGFSMLDQTRSLVSYADGGRTLLLRFLCAPEPGHGASAEDLSRWGAAADPQAAAALLAASVPEFASARAILEACRICVEKAQPSDSPQISYHLRCSDPGTGRPFRMELSGLMFADRAAAAVAHSVARQLYRPPGAEGDVAIPEPVALLEDPPVVVFRFNPRLNLGQLLKQSDDLQLEPASIAIAARLRSLHESLITLADQETMDQAIDRHRAAGDAVIERLAEETDAGRRAGVQTVLHRVDARRRTMSAIPAAPIHGGFGWKQIACSDERLYLTDLGSCRRSHPGFDVGGFLADLRRFCLLRKRPDQEEYAATRGAFLAAYGGDHPPGWLSDAPFFEACALLLRMQHLLGRLPDEWEHKLDSLLRTALTLV